MTTPVTPCAYIRRLGDLAESMDATAFDDAAALIRTLVYGPPTTRALAGPGSPPPVETLRGGARERIRLAQLGAQIETVLAARRAQLDGPAPSEGRLHVLIANELAARLALRTFCAQWGGWCALWTVTRVGSDYAWRVELPGGSSGADVRLIAPDAGFGPRLAARLNYGGDVQAALPADLRAGPPSFPGVATVRGADRSRRAGVPEGWSDGPVLLVVELRRQLAVSAELRCAATDLPELIRALTGR